jgi:uncharacterized membrane protein
MERRHEVTRVEGFSDAVFGFALTLLVVSLDVPKSTAELLELMKGFVPFGLMFAMICWIWYEHQKFFRRYGLQDAWTITLNAVLLFVVLFYVYPLKFLTIGLANTYFHMGNASAPVVADRGDAVMLLYSAGVVLIFGSFVLLYSHAWRCREAIALTREERTTLIYARRGHLLSGALGVVSIVIVLAGQRFHVKLAPMYAGLIYALMGPLHAVNGYMTGKAQESLRPSPPTRHAKR